jgi:hypothetical protein
MDTRQTSVLRTVCGTVLRTQHRGRRRGRLGCHQCSSSHRCDCQGLKHHALNSHGLVPEKRLNSRGPHLHERKSCKPSSNEPVIRLGDTERTTAMSTGPGDASIRISGVGGRRPGFTAESGYCSGLEFLDAICCPGFRAEGRLRCRIPGQGETHLRCGQDPNSRESTVSWPP